jgi:hypothetical protein
MHDLKCVKIYGSGVGSKVAKFPKLFHQEDIDQQISCVCVCVCIYIYIYYTHTHTHISIYAYIYIYTGLIIAVIFSLCIKCFHVGM